MSLTMTEPSRCLLEARICSQRCYEDHSSVARILCALAVPGDAHLKEELLNILHTVC